MIILAYNAELSFLLKDEIIAIVAYAFLYLTYYFFSDFPFVKKYRSRFQESSADFERSVYLRRTMGLILLGIVPFVLALIFFDQPITSYGIGLPSGQYAYLWFLIPTILLVMGSIFRSNKAIDTSYYPEVRKKTWTSRRHFVNAGFWAVYLLGYEFAIRGFVFFSSLYAFGLWPAVVINSILYSFIHIFKGFKEAYGAFFLGILFCLITYYTDSIWIAFIIHVSMAVINDIKAVKAVAKTDGNEVVVEPQQQDQLL
ncbi:MAG: CPBP family intramembrane glutamic endopeptidase [Candidatus Izemoplasmatales bacterium]|jgi:membrane protease YdiL (CAAX protease family)|nr:CPBP family intramembrane metalloprotease [Candidatus Izemoplasmatales bacterium]